MMLPSEMVSATLEGWKKWVENLRLTLEMIKFEHSVFALPFALMGALLALRGWPTGRQLFWIILAMLGARSAAMTFNRIADLRYDALNPRTATRPLGTGQLSLRFAAVFTVVCSGLLVLAAYQLHALAFKLSPLVLVILFAYSYTKRITLWSHLLLGFCLGLAPLGAALGVSGGVSAGVILLGTAVMFWVAGFDMIYACQDLEFDRRVRLHSFPQRYGIKATLHASTALHLLMLGTLAMLISVEKLGWLSIVGLVVVAALLAYERSLVNAQDLSRVNTAFFTVNGCVSFLFFAFWAGDVLLLHSAP